MSVDGRQDLWHLLEAPAAEAGRVALIIGEQRTTYADLESATRRSAGALAAAGVRPGDRVPVVDHTSVAAVAALLGAPRIGAAVALLNPRLTRAELATLLHISGAGPVAVAGRTGTDALGGQRRVLDAPGAGGTEVVAPAGPPPPEDEAVVLFTSGTTGTPKAIGLRHGMLASRITAFAPRFDPGTDQSVSLMCVPLVHIGGSLGLLVALGRGDATVVQTRFDAGEWLALVERHRVRSAFVVPTMLHRILAHPRFPDTDLSSLVLLTYGAAPASPELIRRAMAALPHVGLANTFGQTETLGSITTLGPDDHAGGRLASVGKPLPGVDIRVVDPTTGTPVPQGALGELWVRTADSVVPASVEGRATPPPGWLATGDMVTEDADGYLYPAGRFSDTINRGGEKFAPLEIETVLRDHPAVVDVAVAGVPDDEMGHRVGVAVVADGPLTAEELRDFSRGRLANFKLPERVVFVDELPYNDFGKVGRKELVRLLCQPAP